MQELWDETNRQEQKVQDQGRLLHKHQCMTIRVLQEDGRKAICKLEVLKSDFEVAKQN